MSGAGLTGRVGRCIISRVLHHTMCCSIFRAGSRASMYVLTGAAFGRRMSGAASKESGREEEGGREREKKRKGVREGGRGRRKREAESHDFVS